MSDRPNPGQTPDERSLRRQLTRSVMRHGCADTPHNRLQAVLSNLVLHLHPARVRRAALRFRVTLCAGGVTLFLFLITVVTGAVLMVHVRPLPELARADLALLEQAVPLGALVRSMHRHAGDWMLVAMVVHMVRVLLAGAYRRPREFNWVLGVVLLVLTVAVAFTGYLLPWSQRGFWATSVAAHLLAAAPVVGSEGPWALLGPAHDLRALLLGGAEVGGQTVIRFYTLHCVILPLVVAAVGAVHLWRVRKDGFSGGL